MTTTVLQVLIADDNDLNRWLLAEQVQDYGVKVHQAVNGHEALLYLSERVFDLAFIDVHMPKLSGIELLSKMAADDSIYRPFCVAVTAHAGAGRRQQLLNDGFDDCLLKPILVADLQRIFRVFIDATSGMSPETYAGQLLRKVEDNRDLAELLLNKLFQQAPSQIATMQHLLEDQQFDQALEIAHQLHGTFCFFGFEDFRARALALEQTLSLVTDDGLDAKRQLQALCREFEWLTAHQQAVFKLLT